MLLHYRRVVVKLEREEKFIGEVGVMRDNGLGGLV